VPGGGGGVTVKIQIQIDIFDDMCALGLLHAVSA
jgi:hypothetical protein